MKAIDIIIPIIAKHRIGINLPLIDFAFRRDWYPVYSNRGLIEELGYVIRIYNVLSLPPRINSDIVLVDHRIQRDLKAIRNNAHADHAEKFTMVKLLSRLKETTNKVVYFDTLDSHTLVPAVLPHVDLYIKKQLLKNTALYKKQFVADRLYTDYYYHLSVNSRSTNTKIPDKTIEEDLFDRHKSKIFLAYNILLALHPPTAIRDIAELLFRRNRRISYVDPNRAREHLISGNFATNYPSEAIAFQRKELIHFLERHRMSKYFSIGMLPYDKYRKTLASSTIVLSPFGYGEICHRDYEAFIAGAALVKPDMSHLRTWPDLFLPDETYIPISWDCNKWEVEFEQIIARKKRLIEVATNGQRLFKELWSYKGRRAFAERFIKMVEGNVP